MAAVTPLFELLRQLIDIASPTGREGDIARFVRDELGRRGLQVELQAVESGRFNVFVPADGPCRVVLCTHLDTVSPFIASSEDDEFIYGRGACDAKGSLAAMMTAAQRLREQRTGGVALLFVVGEEHDSGGARAGQQNRA